MAASVWNRCQVEEGMLSASQAGHGACSLAAAQGQLLLHRPALCSEPGQPSGGKFLCLDFQDSAESWSFFPMVSN